MELSSKERILTAMKLGVPDRVPVMPDMSNMIPCRLTGKPFWDIYMHDDPDLYYAYADAVDYFGIDGWFWAYHAVNFIQENQVPVQYTVESRTDTRIITKTTWQTPSGDLVQRDTYYIDNSPTKTEKMVKDIEEDFPKIKHLYNKIIKYDPVNVEAYKKRCGDKGIFTLAVNYPGMQLWHEYFEGGAIGAVYANCDYPEIMEEWAQLIYDYNVSRAEIFLDQKPDVLLLGGSGTLTLSTPELVRKYCIPTIKTITKMAKEAGIPTMMHSCGISYELVKMLVEETDLNCINPLEAPPLGDIDLAQVKKEFGDKICLMGNVNTVELMLSGTPEEVEIAAKKCIDDAGAGGGYILSTGDQCGRDTPDANIFKLVEVSKTYGKY